jgi:hypothetical protein
MRKNAEHTVLCAVCEPRTGKNSSNSWIESRQTFLRQELAKSLSNGDRAWLATLSKRLGCCSPAYPETLPRFHIARGGTAKLLLLNLSAKREAGSVAQMVSSSASRAENSAPEISRLRRHSTKHQSDICTITQGQRNKKYVACQHWRSRLHLVPFFENVGLSEIHTKLGLPASLVVHIHAIRHLSGGRTASGHDLKMIRSRAVLALLDFHQMSRTFAFCLNGSAVGSMTSLLTRCSVIYRGLERMRPAYLQIEE